MAHMIEMKRVSKFYSNRETVSTGFSKVDLNLDIGEFVVITGESGGGKSTLLNVISGLDTYEEGEMFVAGEDTSAFRTEDYENYRKTYIGNIFQDFNLVNSYTVYQNVELVLLLNGHSKGDIKKGIMRILDWVGLREYARTKVSRLSGGQRQRVAIARAFAKNSPIIVADEPTGNLDSESAKRVMEILAAMAKDRLVIVVTHNYEQAEPYATRKIMMRDGRIIEDNVIRPSEIIPYVTEEEKRKAEKEAELAVALDEEAEKEALKQEKKRERERREEKKALARIHRLSKGAQLRLGVRNTFNLKAKFLLLLFIYVFICTAVIGEYAAMMNSQHQSDISGDTEYFFDSSPNRIIMHRTDKKAFTDDDVKAVTEMENVDHVIRNDLALDRTVSLESSKYFIEGPVYNASVLKESQLAYGRLPQNDREFVIGTDSMSEAYEDLKAAGKKIIGKSYYIDSYDNQMGAGGRISPKKSKVVGILFKKAENQKVNNYGYSRLYVTDGFANKLLIASVASTSKTVFTFGDQKVSDGSGQKVFYADNLAKGKAYILQEDAETYYPEAQAVGKDLRVSIVNKYFTSKSKLKVEKVITTSNIQATLGFKKSDYDTYTGCVFVSKSDYHKLYDRGDFQISVFAKDEHKTDDLVSALKAAGYEPLAMKTLISQNGGSLDFVGKLIQGALMLVLFLVLFFIAYAVIRLIMRSRNTYYSTLRILGATQKNTSSILRIELMTVMLIAAGLVAGFILLVRQNILALPAVKSYLAYIQPEGYGILFAILFIMSLLIASRYSRRIFARSAMNVYRGEV